MNKNKGFTLAELLVAMSMFLVLIGIATGGFVRALRTQRATVELMAINDNAVLAIEQIAREMRTGRDFSEISGNELQFVNANGLTVLYRLNDEGVEKGIKDADTSTVSYEKITADNVKVVDLNFTVFNEPGYPPRVTVGLSVSGKNSYIKDVITNIQTTISSRAI